MSKLILLDLDGTLLGPKESISDFNLKALNSFYNLHPDNEIIITTGRSPNSIGHIIKKIDDFCIKKIRYVSCFNGSYIYDYSESKILSYQFINESVAYSIIDFLIRYRIGAIYYSDNNSQIVANTTTFFSRLFYKWFAKKKTKITKKIPKNVYKITVISSSRKVKNIYNFIKNHFNKSIDVFLNHDNCIEIAPKNISKKSSFIFLNNILNFDNKNVWAFGDQSNDYDLLATDINSVCMSSSKKEIVEVSKFITNKEVKQENQVGEFINEKIIKKNLKVFSIDLDGTLLNKDLSIDEETILSIKRAVALGHSIFINTGRPLSEAISFYSKLGLENQKYISACNGSILYSLEKNDYIYSITISRSEVISIFKTSLKNNHKFIFYLFSSDSSQFKVDSMDIKDLEKLDLGSINKIIIKSESISSDLEITFQVSHMEPDFYEITAKNVSKASSCKKVAELENLTPLNFVSVGDSLNDLSHIKWANSSWAVSNAVDEIKSIANNISSYSNSQGVKECIDNEIKE